MAGDTTGPPVSIVILAGGQSRRMGRDKAFIEFDGRPLIARVIERVRALSSDLIIVANNSQAFESFGTRLVGDVYPGKGSLGGLYSGLEAAREQYVVALACDMPFVNADLIAYLVSQAPGFDVVIPRAKDPSGKSKRAPRFHDLIAREIDLHPLHAIYAKSCMEPIRARLTADDLRIIGFLDSVRVRTVEQEDIDRYDPRHLSFFNLNTPEAIEIASHYGI